MNEASAQLKAAMEMEQVALAELIEEAEGDGWDALDFVKTLLLIERCTSKILAMTIEGVAANFDDAKLLSQRLSFVGFDLASIEIVDSGD